MQTNQIKNETDIQVMVAVLTKQLNDFRTETLSIYNEYLLISGKQSFGQFLTDALSNYYIPSLLNPIMGQDVFQQDWQKIKNIKYEGCQKYQTRVYEIIRYVQEHGPQIETALRSRLVEVIMRLNDIRFRNDHARHTQQMCAVFILSYLGTDYFPEKINTFHKMLCQFLRIEMPQRNTPELLRNGAQKEKQRRQAPKPVQTQESVRKLRSSEKQKLLESQTIQKIKNNAQSTSLLLTPEKKSQNFMNFETPATIMKTPMEEEKTPNQTLDCTEVTQYSEQTQISKPLRQIISVQSMSDSDNSSISSNSYNTESSSDDYEDCEEECDMNQQRQDCLIIEVGCSVNTESDGNPSVTGTTMTNDKLVDEIIYKITKNPSKIIPPVIFNQELGINSQQTNTMSQDNVQKDAQINRSHRFLSFIDECIEGENNQFFPVPQDLFNEQDGWFPQ